MKFIFREAALLFDEKSSSISSQFHIAMVIAHELAHQWFGNLVTMKWWTDLWLNEGFATYMAYIAVYQVSKDKIIPTDSYCVGSLYNGPLPLYLL